MISDDERLYWLGFSAFPGIGPIRFKLLRKYFGSAKAAWHQPAATLAKTGMGAKLTDDFGKFRQDFSLKGYWQKLAEKQIHTVDITSPFYPPLLKQISDPPYLLYIRGNLRKKWDLTRTVAVVGTRQVTNYGQEATRRITTGLARANLTIVSGMAYGVDTVAHQAAIEAQTGTIAVLGCGVDIIHPVTNTRLYWRIIKNSGWVISEYPLGKFASRGLFPARNRIISGLSQGVCVVEGAKNSGALITARYAADQGREVFAVPGPITSYLSDGPTILLKQGAKLVTVAGDILEELNIDYSILKTNAKNQAVNKSLTGDEKKIVEILSAENLHFDEIVRKSAVEASKLAAILTMMEMKLIVKNLGNGTYSILR